MVDSKQIKNVGMYVTTVPNKQSIEASSNAILKILQCKQEQETIRKALEVFGGCVEANPVTISGCNIAMKE